MKLTNLLGNKYLFSIVIALLVGAALAAIVPELKTFSQIHIKVESGHAYEQHGSQVNEAFRCMQKNGTKAVLSERSSRNLHWLCLDPDTMMLYDVITSILTKTIQRPSGESTLITAYAPETNGAKATVEWYVEHLQMTKEAIIVNLRAFPGNIFFGP